MFDHLDILVDLLTRFLAVSFFFSRSVVFRNGTTEQEEWDEVRKIENHVRAESTILPQRSASGRVANS